MKKFTKFQKEEILYKLDIRVETILEDIESATTFERDKENLDKLRAKIIDGNMDFTADEKQWLKEELEDLNSGHEANIGLESGRDNMIVLAHKKSIDNALDKIK